MTPQYVHVCIHAHIWVHVLFWNIRSLYEQHKSSSPCQREVLNLNPNLNSDTRLWPLFVHFATLHTLFVLFWRHDMIGQGALSFVCCCIPTNPLRCKRNHLFTQLKHWLAFVCVAYLPTFKRENYIGWWPLQSSAKQPFSGFESPCPSLIPCARVEHQQFEDKNRFSFTRPTNTRMWEPEKIQLHGSYNTRMWGPE